jgi:hypothetical protein
MGQGSQIVGREGGLTPKPRSDTSPVGESDSTMTALR